MREILWHGRGGQGAFTAARLLGAAYAIKGYYALAFPSFGPERRGAPIRAFTKLDEREIGNRSEIEKADYSIFLDDTLFSDTAFGELKPDGKILINSKKRFLDDRVIAFDADLIAEEVLKLPITNTIMLGAFVAVGKDIDKADAVNAIRQYMPQKLHEKNIKAVEAAINSLKGAAV